MGEGVWAVENHWQMLFFVVFLFQSFKTTLNIDEKILKHEHTSAWNQVIPVCDGKFGVDGRESRGPCCRLSECPHYWEFFCSCTFGSFSYLTDWNRTRPLLARVAVAGSAFVWFARFRAWLRFSCPWLKNLQLWSHLFNQWSRFIVWTHVFAGRLCVVELLRGQFTAGSFSDAHLVLTIQTPNLFCTCSCGPLASASAFQEHQAVWTETRSILRFTTFSVMYRPHFTRSDRTKPSNWSWRNFCTFLIGATTAITHCKDCDVLSCFFKGIVCFFLWCWNKICVAGKTQSFGTTRERWTVLLTSSIRGWLLWKNKAVQQC